jgi:hypothetical protein
VHPDEIRGSPNRLHFIGAKWSTVAQRSAIEASTHFPAIVNSDYAADAADKKGPHEAPAGGHNITDKAADRHANKNAELDHREKIEPENASIGERRWIHSFAPLMATDKHLLIWFGFSNRG